MSNKSSRNIRYEDANLISLMGFIVETHTEHYKSDFETDKEVLWEAAKEENTSDHTFIWICRKNGTWLLKEHNVFIKNTREYNTLCYYAGQKDNDNLLFAVEISGVRDDSIRVNLTTLDYTAYYQNVVKHSQSPANIWFVYELGSRLMPCSSRLLTSDDTKLGKFKRFEFSAQDEEMLTAHLIDELRIRKGFKTVNFN